MDVDALIARLDAWDRYTTIGGELPRVPAVRNSEAAAALRELQGERDQMYLFLERACIERDALKIQANAMRKDKDAACAEREALKAENDRLLELLREAKFYVGQEAWRQSGSDDDKELLARIDKALEGK